MEQHPPLGLDHPRPPPGPGPRCVLAGGAPPSAGQAFWRRRRDRGDGRQQGRGRQPHGIKEFKGEGLDDFPVGVALPQYVQSQTNCVLAKDGDSYTPKLKQIIWKEGMALLPGGEAAGGGESPAVKII